MNRLRRRQCCVIMAALLFGSLPWAVGCGGARGSAVRSRGGDAGAQQVAPEITLRQAEQALAGSRYAVAEPMLRQLLRSKVADTAQERLGLLLLTTGRHAEAIQTLQGTSTATAQMLVVSALLARGQLDQALKISARLAERPSAWAARRQLGEILLRQGRRGDAEAVLHQVIDAYNDDVIGDDDAAALAEVGRVAHLLRSPQDANDAFNLAEQASSLASDQLLLWRAEMLLERHDPNQATEVLMELLVRAPNHPVALARLAQARLAQSLDLQAAEDLANRALASDPTSVEAHFVLAGVRLRDMEIAAAEAQLHRGLTHDPNQLELLSLRATARFLAGDDAGFAAVEQRVLALNPQFAHFYTIVAEYADWEHRYREVVQLLRRAVTVDENEAAAHAGLGLNLIRLGDETAGRTALQRAFALDPFDVRVFNTLNLFEKVIDTDYESQDLGVFRFRYPRAERAILERQVPQLMTEAWQHMVGAYGMTPETPVGVELYSEREHFAVRTSGLPNTGISGVCFGKTLAVITPHGEALNLGMTLWHELAHVFHIQLSNSRVPRWFTEGLAEYETLVRRPEWSREHDLDLYRAWRERRLPSVAQMNRAFSHAESMQDMAVAYYASAQLVTLLAEHFGRDKLRRMLQLWGEGKMDEAVFAEGLGVPSAQIDRLFDDFLTQRLKRYRDQFVALGNSGSSAKWRNELQRSPQDVSVRLRLAQSLLEEGQLEHAEQVVAELLERQPREPQALFLKARLEEPRDPKACARTLRGLIDAEQRGYDSYMLHARCSNAAGEDPVASLREAHRFDPTQAQPLYGLLQTAQRAADEEQELTILRELAKLEQHDSRVYLRLLELLVKRGADQEAVLVGQSAIWVDAENPEVHSLYAQALRAVGQLRAAQWELDTARAAQ